MTKPRVPETDHGIQGKDMVAAYDELQRSLRDKKYIRTADLLERGIRTGHVLELGPGPGYLGLEWLKATEGTRLTGLDISPDMVALAGRNAVQYGMQGRTAYDQGSGERLPYADGTFDAVFSNGSLHEWSRPQETILELYRVTRPGGIYYVSDMRRDMHFLLRGFLWLTTTPAFIRPYLLSSIDAAYTPSELRLMLAGTLCAAAEIAAGPLGMVICGRKNGAE